MHDDDEVRVEEVVAWAQEAAETATKMQERGNPKAKKWFVIGALLHLHSRDLAIEALGHDPSQCLEV